MYRPGVHRRRYHEHRTGVYVYLLPLRHPIVTAKSVGSLDALSGGRVLMGIGIGWLAEEFDAVGACFHDRAARAGEAIEVIRKLWRDDVVDHHGGYYDITRMGMEPKPPRGSVPLLMGGHTGAALRRAAELGDGWIGSAAVPNDLAGHLESMIPRITKQLAVAGRTRDGFDITSAVIGVPTFDQAVAAQEAGLNRLIVAPWALAPGASAAQAPNDLERLADTVLTPLSAASTRRRRRGLIDTQGQKSVAN